MDTIEERLLNGSQILESGCRVWTRARSGGHRYGKLKVDGRSYATHRLAFETWRGPIPDGLCVLHHCDNPPCINPDHLFLGSHADNAKDRETKGRANRPRGSQHANAVLDEIDVRQIKFAAARGVPYYLLAKKFRVSNSAIELIAHGQRWAHVEPAEHEDIDVAALLARARLLLHTRMARVRKRGEQHGRAKLTEDLVREIRREYATGRHSMRELAHWYSVAWATIRDLLNGKNWSHVT